MGIVFLTWLKYGNTVGSRDKVPNSNFGWITSCVFLCIYFFLLSKCQDRIFRKDVITPSSSLRPSSFTEKVGINKKRGNSETIFPSEIRV